MALSTTNENILSLRLERTNLVMFLEECRKKKEFTDVQLQIGDELFDAHRVVLSHESPVLKALISDQWSTSKICPISGEYVDPSIVEELLHFLYTRSIDLTPDNVHPVCVAAHFLQIPSLLEPAVQHLCRLISVDNVLNLFEFSLNYQLERLRDSCLRFIVNKNSEVFQSSQIPTFPMKNFYELIAGLKGQFWDLRTNLRVNTFHCICRWTETNLSERSSELPGLLKSIPLEELPHDFLTDTMSSHPLVNVSISGLLTVSPALENYQAVLKPGWQTGQNLIALGVHRKAPNTVRCYDLLNESWRVLPDMLQPRRHFDCTVINRRDIVVSHGIAADYIHRALDSIEVFDWATQTWRILPGLLPSGSSQFNRIQYSIGTLNNQLYAVGGQTYNYSKKPSTLHRYSFETQQWKPLSSLKIPRGWCELVEYDNYLYAFGGGTKTVEKYDPTTDQWSVMERLSVSASNFTIHRGNLYALQGSKLLASDQETGKWSTIATFDKTSIEGNLVSINGRLIASDRQNDISEFDFYTRKWQKFCKLTPKLDIAHLIVRNFLN